MGESAVSMAEEGRGIEVGSEDVDGVGPCSSRVGLSGGEGGRAILVGEGGVVARWMGLVEGMVDGASRGGRDDGSETGGEGGSWSSLDIAFEGSARSRLDSSGEGGRGNELGSGAIAGVAEG